MINEKIKELTSRFIAQNTHYDYDVKKIAFDDRIQTIDKLYDIIIVLVKDCIKQTNKGKK